jgi:hypothetical protein
VLVEMVPKRSVTTSKAAGELALFRPLLLQISFASDSSIE